MKFTIHYMKPEFFRDGNMGYDWLEKRSRLPSLSALDRTHVELKTLADFDNGRIPTNRPDIKRVLEIIFAKMQGENWSPNGEARDLIRSKGLEHTSMSVGDVVVVDDAALWIVDRFGFKEVA